MNPEERNMVDCVGDHVRRELGIEGEFKCPFCDNHGCDMCDDKSKFDEEGREL